MGSEDEKREGFTLIELMIVVAIVGILSAVAFPSFVTYFREAKTIEATDGLMEIAKAATAHYQEIQYGEDGKEPLPRQFPASVNLTPPYSCCDSKSKPRCLPNNEIWQHSSWKQLAFKRLTPHYYRYSFHSSGQEGTATFTIQAIGDLNCDGRTSTFTLTGHADDKGNVHLKGPIIEGKLE